MPFGLHSVPATFQRLLDTVLGPDLEPHVFVYLDDIIIISKTFTEHLELLTETFRRLRNAQLRLNPDKCKFCVDKLKYLGHIIDREGIRTDPEKVSAVADWPEPRTVKQIRQFIGMASWYRRFIASFSEIAAPLTRLTKKNARWTCGTEQAEAFRTLKAKLVSATVLACPDFTKRFVLQTDASTSGLGAVLTQQHEDGERVIAYASRTLNTAERNYTATELECLAIVWGIRRMKLSGRLRLHSNNRPSGLKMATTSYEGPNCMRFSSIRVSPDFVLTRHSSPSFESQRVRSGCASSRVENEKPRECEAASRRGPSSLGRRPGPTFTFITPLGLATSPNDSRTC